MSDVEHFIYVLFPSQNAKGGASSTMDRQNSDLMCIKKPKTPKNLDFSRFLSVSDLTSYDVYGREIKDNVMCH